MPCNTFLKIYNIEISSQVYPNFKVLRKVWLSLIFFTSSSRDPYETKMKQILDLTYTCAWGGEMVNFISVSNNIPITEVGPFYVLSYLIFTVTCRSRHYMISITNE